MEKALPAIPAKRYFTIGEVSDLCGVKPYVLRYWEQEFTQLKPMKRRGNRRYYQHHEVLLIRRIRDLLYDQGFTISGARNQLSEGLPPGATELGLDSASPAPVHDANESSGALKFLPTLPPAHHLSARPLRTPAASMSIPTLAGPTLTSLDEVRSELLDIRACLLG